MTIPTLPPDEFEALLATAKPGLSYSAEMMRAKLAGKKDVTRRPIRSKDCPRIESEPDHFQFICRDDGELLDNDVHSFIFDDLQGGTPTAVRPRFRVGQLYYAREQVVRCSNLQGGIEHDIRYALPEAAEGIQAARKMRLAASCMPRISARLIERIVSVRPERLQEITEEDAKREGVTPFPRDLEGDCWTDGKYRTAFQYLYNELYGWEPNAWGLNPWVWRYETEIVALRTESEPT